MVELLVGLFLVLALVTVVGHGIWLVTAAFISEITGKSPDASTNDPITSWQSPLRRLYDLQWRIDQLRKEDILDPEQHTELTAVLRQEIAKRKLPLAADKKTRPAAAGPPVKPVLKTPPPVETGKKPVPTELVFEDEAPPQPVAARQPHPVEPPRPAPPPQPKAPFADMLQAFMEQRNIHWGELISGMLIIGSSIGLVISLWSKLREVAYFPALLFLLATAAIHGAGLYTLKKWKLRSTSRGLLAIAGLLIPLNYLAAIALSEQRPITDPYYLASVAVGSLAFAAMAWSGGRTLLLCGTWPYVIALWGTSTSQLVIARQVVPHLPTARLYAIVGIPLACYFVSLIMQLRQTMSWSHLTRRRIAQIFMVLGAATFALLTTLGLVVWKSQDIAGIAADLSPLLNLALIPALGLGLVIHHRATSPSLAKLHTAGTAVALLAAGLMVATVALAWPHPGMLIVITAMDFAALTAMAVTGRLPYLHTAAVIALSLGGLLGYHVATGQLAWNANITGLELWQVLFMGRSSVILSGFAAVAAAGAYFWRQVRDTDESIAYGVAAAGLAVVSVLVAGYAGFISGVDRDWTTLVFAISAVNLLTANAWLHRPAVTWASSAFLFVALLHGLIWNETAQVLLTTWQIMPERPFLAACLLHATICCGTLLAIWRQPRPSENDPLWHGLARPLGVSTAVTSAIAVPLIVVFARTAFLTYALGGLWVAVLWIVLSYLWQSQWGFAAAQGWATIAITFAVTALCRRQPWWNGHAYFDPRFLQAQMAALAAWGMLFTVGRWSLRNARHWPSLWQNTLTSVDRVVLGGVIVGSILLITAGCVPGLNAELQHVAADAAAKGIHPLMIGGAILIAAGVVVAASLALIPKRRIAAVSGLSALTAAWALPVWDNATQAFWEFADVPHTYAYGSGAWLVGLIIFAAVAVALWERYSTTLVAGMLFLTLSIPLLIAGPWEFQHGTATALRWGLALHTAVIAVVISGQHYWLPLLARFSPRVEEPLSTTGMTWLRSLALTLTLTPLLALTLRQIVLLAPPGAMIAGPVMGTWWSAISPPWSLGIPLGIVAAVFALYALRERSPHFAIAGLFTLNLAASVALILSHWATGAANSAEAIVAFAQWNAVVCAGCAVACLLVRQRIEPLDPGQRWSAFRLASPLEFPVLLAGSLTALLAVWAAVAIIALPASPLPMTVDLGGPLSYTALAFSLAAAWLYYRNRPAFSRLTLIPIAALSCVMFVAASTARYNTPDHWLSYHVLVGGVSAVSVLAAAVAMAFTYRPKWRAISFAQTGIAISVSWAVALGGFVLFLATRGLWHDPDRPWWSAVPVGITAATAAALALSERQQRFAYISAALSVMATAFVWMQPWLDLNLTPNSQSVIELAQACLLALTASGIVWLIVELICQRRLDSRFDVKSGWPPFPHTAAAFSLIGLGFLSLLGLIVQHYPQSSFDGSFDTSNAGVWWLAGMLGLLLTGMIWDRWARHVVLGLYALGVATIGLILHDFDLSVRHLALALGVISGGGTLVGGALWFAREKMAAAARRIKVAHADELFAKAEHWMPAATVIQTAVCVAIGFWSVVSFEESPLRYYAATAMASTVLGVLAIANGNRRYGFQVLTLLLVAVAAVGFSWAPMPVSGESAQWLHRAIRVLVVATITSCVYGGVLIRGLRRESAWLTSLRKAASTMAVATAVTLGTVLAMEAAWFDPVDGAPVSGVEIATVVSVLALSAVVLVMLAVQRREDPWGVSDRGRMLYVYAAEIVVALVFLHVYLSMPELFTGRIRAYWPMIVMVIAFFGVGVGEVLRRSRIFVLSEPLQQTGAFLPFLPALGFWLLSSNTSYSTVLFVVGLLYVLLSLLRRKLWQGVAAGLAGNAGLWALWHEHGTDLWEHPQLWMIPPALSVLAAAQWNRRKLNEPQLTTLRYASVIVIYVSSTGDMFITGIAESLWMPIILALLSVAGVFAGILLRVRAFIYLGASFLLVSIVSMVSHAAQSIHHVWPWWAFGIVSGLLILTMFGVFEKKRNEVLRLVGEFRHWEP